MDIIHRGEDGATVIPHQGAKPSRVQAKIRKGHARRGPQHRQAVQHPVPQEQAEQPPLRVNGQVMPREAAEPKGLLPHVYGNFAEKLVRVLHIALAAQVLGVPALRERTARAVLRQEAQALPGQHLAPQYPLAEADHVPPGGKQPRVTAQVRPLQGEQPRLGVVNRARGDAPAQDVPRALDAVLQVAGGGPAAFPLGHMGKGVPHLQGTQDAAAQAVEEALPRRAFHHVLEHHGVHVRVIPPRAQGLGHGEEKLPQPFLPGGLGINAGRGGQPHGEGEHPLHGHLPQVRKLWRVRRHRPGEVQQTFLPQAQHGHAREDFRQAGQIKEGILSQGNVLPGGLLFPDAPAGGVACPVRCASGNGEAGHDALVLHKPLQRLFQLVHGTSRRGGF